ncbi:HPT domain containing protein [Vibrio ishigakensis]|uniref:HPT domain containing protein n=1 Tax=Vibrio ishigakensis TaxID=1481914 RepID=A0A0B8PFN0_9VIBR|nr:HPT domain containing protein [Vibrio ishigakensis]
MIDVDKLSETFDGDDEVVTMILSLYLDENADIGDKLVGLHQESNLGELYSLAHTLSGTLSNLCEEETSSLLKTVELDANGGKQSDKAVIDEINVNLSKIEEQITLYLS